MSKNAEMNQTRAGRAALLINAYDRLPDVESGAPADQHLTDILSDLRHMCHLNGIDFARSLSMSEMHFDEERVD